MIVVCSIESVHTEQQTFMYVMSKYGSSRVEVVVVVVVVLVAAVVAVVASFIDSKILRS